MRLWSRMPDCSFEELIPIFPARYPEITLYRRIADYNPGWARLGTRLSENCPMSKTLQNLLVSFTSSWPMPRPDGDHNERVYMHEASRQVTMWNWLGIPCVTQVFTMLKIALTQTKPATRGKAPVLEVKENKGYWTLFTAVPTVAEWCI